MHVPCLLVANNVLCLLYLGPMLGTKVHGHCVDNYEMSAHHNLLLIIPFICLL